VVQLLVVDKPIPSHGRLFSREDLDQNFVVDVVPQAKVGRKLPSHEESLGVPDPESGEDKDYLTSHGTESFPVPATLLGERDDGAHTPSGCTDT
jgi:hypothetical protein